MKHDFCHLVKADDSGPLTLEEKVARVAEVAAQNKMNFDCAPSDDGAAYEVHASTDDDNAACAFKMATADLVVSVVSQ